MVSSNKVLLRLCDAVDQPSANTCANMRLDRLRSDRFFCWSQVHQILLITSSQPKMDTGIILKRVNYCVLKNPFWREFSNRLGKIRNAFSDAQLMSRFSKFRSTQTKTRSAHFLKPRVLINELITEISRSQRFWEVVFFTAFCPK